MRLAHLSLTDFRNFASLQIDVPPGPILMVGANAQGKTSLLEAIYYLVGASSPHTSSDRQLLRLDSVAGQEIPVGRITAQIERRDSQLRIEIRLILETISDGSQRSRKQILVNGSQCRAAELYGQFNAVLFLPQDVEIVEGSPGQRRRQLDATLSQADPDYAQLMSQYGKLLTQRNALLKRLQERRGQPAELDFWDERMSGLAAQLVLRRAVFLAGLQSLAAPVHAELSRGAERLALTYQPSFPESVGDLPSGPQAQQAMAQQFVEELRERRNQQIRRGVTTFGPHRDDLSFVVDGRDLRSYGSRGQNRTAILAYKLAEIEWIKRSRGEMPVLLMDEVLAELDPDRRADLQQLVLDAPQALLTGADLAMFDADFQRRATLWQVSQGRVTPIRT